jgi:predicted molibdopterin-dependent oxidoreductase YjgC
MTGRTRNRDLAPRDYLEMHPDDADRLHIADGENVCVQSRWGSTAIAAKVTSRVAPGVLFASFHYPESHVNRLIGPHVDPDSKCPDYKVAAVRVERHP